VFIGGVTALALFLGLLVLALPGLLANPCAAKYFYACNWVLVAAVLLTYVFAGMFVAVGVVSSDVCVAPSPALVSLAKLGNPGQSALDTVSFYTSCGMPGATVAPAGAYASVLNGSANIATAVANANAFANDPFIQGNPGYAPYTQSLQTQLGAASNSVAAVAAYANCSAVFSIYNDMVTSLCTKGAPAVITVWALATAGCLMMLIIVAAAARLVWKHPGMEEEDATAYSTATAFRPLPSTTYNPAVLGGAAAYGGTGTDWGRTGGR
jgi:hypothetical protein